MSQWLLLFLGVVGSWIAIQQMLIARQKLNHDLFDRRFAVYIATRDYIVSVLNRDNELPKKSFDYHRAIAPAPFLFGADIAEYVREVQRKGAAVQTFLNSAEGGQGGEIIQEYTRNLNESLTWLGGEFDNDRLIVRFQPSLNLSRLRPLAVTEILPRIDFASRWRNAMAGRSSRQNRF